MLLYRVGESLSTRAIVTETVPVKEGFPASQVTIGTINDEKTSLISLFSTVITPPPLSVEEKRGINRTILMMI